MLRLPVFQETFSDALPPNAPQSSSFSAHSAFAVESKKMVLIGSGAFGSVRLGWLQERRYQTRRIAGKDGEKTESIVLIGTCAAVAVKRVVIKAATPGSCGGRRLMLMRELCVMEQIRIHPHPNVVQCWGFFLGKTDDDPSLALSASMGNPTDASFGGRVLTSLTREQQQTNVDSTDDKKRMNNDFFDDVSYVDLCLSLCTGGTLGEYVNRKAREVYCTATNIVLGPQVAQQINLAPTAPAKTDLGSSAIKKDINESTAGGISSCSVDCSSAHLSHGQNRSSVVSLQREVFIEPQLAVRERDVVSILYALVSALRHTHDILKTLHRDIKPANVLICSGVGKTPKYVLQSFSGSHEQCCTETLHNSGIMSASEGLPSTLKSNTNKCCSSGDSVTTDSLELALFTEHPTTADFSTQIHTGFSEKLGTKEEKKAQKEKWEEDSSATLVLPLGSERYRLKYVAADLSDNVYIDYMPQVEAWRIQLADFGVSTGVGQLVGSGRCGTFPFMAPEVASSYSSGPEGQYGTKADIYSLGVTLQYVLVHVVVGGDEGNQATRRHMDALGAQWVDEDDSAIEFECASGANFEGCGFSAEVQPRFVVPRAWRCDRELDNEQYIDSALHRGHQSGRCTLGSVELDSDHKTFTVPRSWRCRDELLEQNYIRCGHAEKNESKAYAHLLASLPDMSKGSRKGSCPRRDRQRQRCRSCGRLHRHLIELLNAMTSCEPSQRPPLSVILQSSAIIDQGTFVDVRNALHSGGADTTEYVLQNFEEEKSTADQLFRAHRRFRQRNRVGAVLSAFSFDVQSPDRKEECVDDNNEENKDSSTVFLWRPPSLNFLRAPRNKTTDVQNLAT